MIRKFFNHEQFNFELQFARGGVHYGAADCRSLRSTKGCSQRHQRSGRTGSGGPNRTACAPPSVFTAARRYNLADVTDQITTPLLITNPGGAVLARPVTATVRETSQYQATCRVHC